MPPKKKKNIKKDKIWLMNYEGYTENNDKIKNMNVWWEQFESLGPDPLYRWYNRAVEYWDKKDSDNHAMLGGFDSISPADIESSMKFLQRFIDGIPEKNVKIETHRAIDVGAGIGRITKNFLAKVFDEVDLVEQNEKFLEQAKLELKDFDSVKNFYQSPLQDFEFPGGPYDVIWIQWVIIYLTDRDLITFFKRAKKALKPNGIIVLKENCQTSKFFLDTSDNSIARSFAHLKLIFDEADLRLVLRERETNFPDGLIPVETFALV